MEPLSNHDNLVGGGGCQQQKCHGQEINTRISSVTTACQEQFLLEGYLNCCQISVTAVSLYLSRTLPRLFLACISFLGAEREMKKHIL
jgi:hypothetical protein